MIKPTWQRLSGPFAPIDYTTGPDTAVAVSRLETGRPIREERKKYRRPTFAEVRQAALQEALHAR